MLISNKIQDRYSASQAWLKRRLELDDLELPDYKRPLKEMKEKRPTRFKSQVIKYGIITAFFKEVIP